MQLRLRRRLFLGVLWVVQFRVSAHLYRIMQSQLRPYMCRHMPQDVPRIMQLFKLLLIQCLTKSQSHEKEKRGDSISQRFLQESGQGRPAHCGHIGYGEQSRNCKSIGSDELQRQLLGNMPQRLQHDMLYQLLQRLQNHLQGCVFARNQVLTHHRCAFAHR